MLPRKRVPTVLRLFAHSVEHHGNERRAKPRQLPG